MASGVTNLILVKTQYFVIPILMAELPIGTEAVKPKTKSQEIEKKVVMYLL